MIHMLADRLSRAESIIIEGHSDQRGKAKYNQKLSQKRAEYIRDQLVEAGLSAESIKVIGLGERQLLVNCRSTICGVKEEQKNRRVEIKAQF
jgi:outer membrane protein OmpA-like peptidoglycan-associated protein